MSRSSPSEAHDLSKRRLMDLTIRELMLELARVEERLRPGVAHRLEAKAKRALVAREHAIIAELRSRSRRPGTAMA
jgi:hypothetical protein